LGAVFAGPPGAAAGAALGVLGGYLIQALRRYLVSSLTTQQVLIIPDNEELEQLSESIKEELARQQEQRAEPEIGR
jgi:hypothetical protein